MKPSHPSVYFRLFVVPELESCSLCGKQVLISRYSWSNSEVICQLCSELNLQKQLRKRNGTQVEESAVIDLQSSHDSTIGNSAETSKNQPNHIQREILVTWSTLLKISLGGLLSMLLILSGYITWRKVNQALPSNKLPTNQVDLIIK